MVLCDGIEKKWDERECEQTPMPVHMEHNLGLAVTVFAIHDVIIAKIRNLYSTLFA